jgi:hypothetical protein
MNVSCVFAQVLYIFENNPYLKCVASNRGVSPQAYAARLAHKAVTFLIFFVYVFLSFHFFAFLNYISIFILIVFLFECFHDSLIWCPKTSLQPYQNVITPSVHDTRPHGLSCQTLTNNLVN